MNLQPKPFTMCLCGFKFKFLLVLVLVTNLAAAQPKTDWLKQPIAHTTETMSLAAWLDYLSTRAGFDYAYNPATIDARKTASLSHFNTTEEALAALRKAFQVEVIAKPGHSIVLKPAISTPKKVTAQSKLSGKVTDPKTLAPIQKAGVYLAATGNYATTGPKGDYQFTVPYPKLKSDLLIVAKGYAPIKKSVIIQGNTFLNTTLQADTLDVKVPDLQAIAEVEKQAPMLSNLLPPDGASTQLLPGDSLQNSPKVLEQIPFSFSLWPGVSSGRWIPTAKIPNISLNVLAGSNAGVQGAELGIFANVLQTDMEGFQAAGVFNVVGGQVTGFSAAGVAGYAGLGVKGFQANGLAGINQGSLIGFQASGLFSATKGNVTGFQVAGLANKAHALNGLQVAGLTNLLMGGGSGMQIAGFTNLMLNQPQSNPLKVQLDSLFWPKAQSYKVSQMAGFFNGTPFHVEGVQLAGFANWCSAHVHGAQVSGVFNHAKKTNGVQIGLINHTRNLNGVQIGLINIADSSRGFPIGLVNIARHGMTELQLHYSENHLASLRLHTYKKAIHWVYAGTVAPFDSSVKVWAGMGLGTAFGLTRKQDLLDFSFTAINQVPLADLQVRQMWLSAEAALSLRLWSGLRLKAGAEINYFMHERNAPGKQLFIPERKPNNFASTNDSVSWVHMKAGLGWRF